MSKSGTIEKPDPWRVPVAIAQIPETGLHRDIEADQAIRHAIADIGGLREVLSAQASFDVTPKSGGRFHVSGQVRARVGQTCVVTLDPMESDIDEEIDLIFAPPEQIPQMAALVDEAEHATVRRRIRRSRSRTESSISAGLPPTRCISRVDPYPRKPDAVFEPLVEATDPEDHPFAALKALKVKPKKPSAKKPKGK